MHGKGNDDLFLSLIDPIPGITTRTESWIWLTLLGCSVVSPDRKGGQLDEACGLVDIDGDADVDLREFAAFQVAFTGDCVAQPFRRAQWGGPRDPRMYPFRRKATPFPNS